MNLRTIKVSPLIKSAPAAIISVMSPTGKSGKKFVARLDTGADVTSVPLWAISDLFLPIDRKVGLRMSNGLVCHETVRRASIEIWDNDVRFGLFDALNGVVVVMNAPCGLLGMDILRYLRLEGYDSQWTLSFPTGVKE